jgi:hypothetical protein
MVRLRKGFDYRKQKISIDFLASSSAVGPQVHSAAQFLIKNVLKRRSPNLLFEERYLDFETVSFVFILGILSSFPGTKINFCLVVARFGDPKSSCHIKYKIG